MKNRYVRSAIIMIGAAVAAGLLGSEWMESTAGTDPRFVGLGIGVIAGWLLYGQVE